jgi:hypothetical protein
MKKLNLSEEELSKRLECLNETMYEMIKIWVANQPKRGYVMTFINKDLKPYGMKFIASKVKTSTFINLTKGDAHALCEILWDDTYTKNRFSFGYSFVNNLITMN